MSACQRMTWVMPEQRDRDDEHAGARRELQPGEGRLPAGRDRRDRAAWYGSGISGTHRRDRDRDREAAAARPGPAGTAERARSSEKASTAPAAPAPRMAEPVR